MKQLSLALLNYEATHGSFPPASGLTATTSTPHSWRVHILPFLEGNVIAEQYDYNQAWNGPQNKSLVSNLVCEEYQCPMHMTVAQTNYFAITGTQTAWGDGSELRKLRDITDGTSNTILLVEAADRGVHWAEPKDLSFDEAMKLLTTPVPFSVSDGHLVDHGYFYKPGFVRHVALCDGSCRALQVPIPREAAIALLTANRGEAIDQAWLENYSRPQLDYGRVWGFALFVVIALLPGIPAVRKQIWPKLPNHRGAVSEVQA